MAAIAEANELLLRNGGIDAQDLHVEGGVQIT
jgi:hypothetical protein